MTLSAKDELATGLAQALANEWLRDRGGGLAIVTGEALRLAHIALAYLHAHGYRDCSFDRMERNARPGGIMLLANEATPDPHAKLRARADTQRAVYKP